MTLNHNQQSGPGAYNVLTNNLIETQVEIPRPSRSSSTRGCSFFVIRVVGAFGNSSKNISVVETKSSPTIHVFKPGKNCATKGAFLVKDDRVLKGPLGRSLRSFACTAHSAHSLCYARLARSLRSGARSLT